MALPDDRYHAWQLSAKLLNSIYYGGTRTFSIRWLYRPSKWHYDGFTDLANMGVPGHFSIWWINILAMIH